MLRLSFLRLSGGGKKPVSEEWKALARKQAAPYRSFETTAPSSSSSTLSRATKTAGSSNSDGGGSSKNNSNSHNSNHHYSSSFPSEDSRGDPRSMRHFFGDAKYDKDGKVIRDIDPVDLEHKVEEYHLSRYR